MAYQTFTLKVAYPKIDGRPASGVVEIVPSESVILDAAGNKILSGKVSIKLDDYGSADVELPDPRDPNLNPTGYGFTVSAKLNHASLPAVSFGGDQIVNGVVELAKVTPVDPATFDPVATYAPSSTVDALGARVTTLEESPGGVTSYNDLTDKPTIPATAEDVGALPDTTTAADLGALPLAETDTQVATLAQDPQSETGQALSDSFAAGVSVSGNALQAYLNALPAWTYGEPIRSVTVFPGDYTLTDAIRVPSGVHLRLYGCKFTLATGTGTDVITNADWAGGNSWITIEGGHLDGNVGADWTNQPNLTSPNPGQSGVTLCNVLHATLRDIFAENNFRHGIDITSRDYVANSTGDDTGFVLIDNCRVRRFGDDGITTHWCHDVTIRDCWGYESGDGGLVGSSHGLELDDGSQDITVDGFVSFGNESNGIVVQSHAGAGQSQGRARLTNCTSFDNSGHGFYLSNQNAGIMGNITMIGCTSHDNLTDGIRVENMRDVTVAGFTSYNDDCGVRIVGNNTRNVTVNDFQIFSPNTSGLQMATAGASGLRFTNGIIRETGGNAVFCQQSDVVFDNIRIDSPAVGSSSSVFWLNGATRVIVSKVNITGSGGPGFVLQGCNKVSLVDCVAVNPAGANRDAVILTGGTTPMSDVRIEGCRFNGWTARGVWVLGSAITNLSIRECDLQGNASSAFTNSGTVTGLVVEQNTGYRTEAASTGTIADAASSVTVSHGLTTTPTVVQLGKRTSEDVWVSARTATTFTVTRAGTTGALTFDWSARLIPA